MNSKRLAVFAASLQWADAVKVVSRGTPRSRTSVTNGETRCCFTGSKRTEVPNPGVAAFIGALQLKPGLSGL